MSEVNKCDRCGTLYEYDYNFYIGKHNIYKDCHPYSDYQIDLCPDCQTELEKWIKGDKMNNVI